MSSTEIGRRWVGLLALSFAVATVAEDWPQWRYDANRSANSPEPLPDHLHLQWVRQYSPREQVWDDPLNHDLMPYDKVFEPVVLGRRMFVGFNDRDKVVALDIDTGRELWTFYADGPVRLPPAAYRETVCFTSDDGCLYCVDAGEGTLRWKFRGAPSARKVLGNRRVISAWPARGGPVIRDGQVCFAASIWPFMGTFIYALDARDGEVIWANEGTGAQYMKQPHSAPAFAGVAPQGALVATRDFLLVPGGRSVPAGFDRKTGELLHFRLDDGGKGNGGSFVAASESEFFVHTRHRGTRTYTLKTGKKGTFTLDEPVITDHALYSAAENSHLKRAVIEAEEKLAAARQTAADASVGVTNAEDEGSASAYKKATNSLASARRKVTRAEAGLAAAQKALGTNWPGCVVQAVGTDKKVRWELEVDGTGDLIKAGQRLYAAGTNSIVVIDLADDDPRPRVVGSNAVDGRVLRLLAANGKLFAVTLDGRIMAFGGNRTAPVMLREEQAGGAGEADPPVESMAPGHPGLDLDGYALWFGVEDGRTLEGVVRHSKLHVVAVDPDAAKVKQLRRRFEAAGLYGARVTVHVGDPLSFQAPPYIASLVVVGGSLVRRLAEPAVLQAAYDPVRPYGGSLWVSTTQADAAGAADQIRAAALPQAEVSVARNGVRVIREGPLPGAADWTHQYGDVANTLKSDDARVKLPLGLLWFGGNTHTDVLPRHGHGPSQQVVGGRLFVEGMSSLSARDVYTGRVLWKTEFENLGTDGVYYDDSYTNTPLSTAYNQKHIPGANARGANFVVTPDAVYVAVSNACQVLDPRTGQGLRTIPIPQRAGEAEPSQWGYIGVYEDTLFAGHGFAHYTRRLGLPARSKTPAILDVSASRGLVAFDRHTGRMIWRIDARHGFLHNGIVAGNGRVYCLDRLPKSATDKLKRRGRPTPSDYRIVALDVRTGQTLWEVETNVFGTWLSYSEPHDALLHAGASATDRLKDEAERGMAAYRGRDGTVLWTNLAIKYTGPCILHGDMILTTPNSYKTNGGAFGLLDGKPRLVVNPLTDQPEPMRIYRTYGCNYPIACEHLLTFRSGAAGFYDLESHSGTGNFGGYKSGCSPSLIAANGVLNSPDYTRTCSCAYQNQTSLALIHMPEQEVWTHNQFGQNVKEGHRIKRVGINFGAPGDRRASNGTLWLDSPSVGGSSPELSVVVSGSSTNYFRRFAAAMQGEGPAWVMASGVADLEAILITPEARRAQPPAAPKKSDEDEEEEDTKNGNDSTDKQSEGSNGEATAANSGPSTSQTNKPEPSAAPVVQPALYTVRLYFTEPESVRVSERVFGVQLQGQPVLQAFDIAGTAGGSWRGVVREFRHVVVKDHLAITFTREEGAKYGPILCGVEMILEEAVARGPTHPAGY